MYLQMFVGTSCHIFFACSIYKYQQAIIALFIPTIKYDCYFSLMSIIVMADNELLKIPLHMYKKGIIQFVITITSSSIHSAPTWWVFSESDGHASATDTGEGVIGIHTPNQFLIQNIEFIH